MNKKTLDLIIPSYNSFEVLPCALATIAIQKISFDLNVIIVNDHSKRSYDKEISLFKSCLNIKEIYLEKNRGVGVARQIGLDNSFGDYIVFMDSDDILYDEMSLQKLYNLMENDKYDYGYGAILIEENDTVNKYDRYDGCLHGKIFSRKLINKYNIKFNTTRTSEDNSFNHICMFNSNNINTTNDIVYIYKDNKTSLTKGLSIKQIITNLGDFIDNISYTMNNINNPLKLEVLMYYIDKFYYVWNCYLYYSKTYYDESQIIIDKLIELDNKIDYYTDQYINKLLPQNTFVFIREQIRNFKNK